MSIGTRIIQIRNEKNITQRELSQRSGIASSYLSRIENRRLEPRPKTLRKISDALAVPLSALFDENPATQTGVRCAVSLSGRCIMEMLRSRGHRVATLASEGYSLRQVQLLRMANYLIVSGNTRLLDTLDLVLGALMGVTGARRGAKDLVTLPARPEVRSGPA